MDTVVDDFVRSHCSPTPEERDLAKKEYERLRVMLPGSMFQTGSYARFTAITPLNDLDVIWVMPAEARRMLERSLLTMDAAISDAATTLREEYRRAGRSVKITPQSHSIMIEFLDLDGDFSIDIVPAHELTEKNEFGQSLYRIPEVGLMNRRQRQSFYESHDASIPMNWIKTDPRGYAEQACRTNELCGSFRKATKLLKKWKVAWKGKSNFRETEFTLKSFHIEIAIQHLVRTDPGLSTLSATERFLANIDAYLAKPQFKDRAQTAGEPTRYIDQYVSDLDDEQRRMIRIAARSGVILIRRLREDKDEHQVEQWLHRLLSGEEFIEGYGFMVDPAATRDNSSFAVDGWGPGEAWIPAWLAVEPPSPCARGSRRARVPEKSISRLRSIPTEATSRIGK